MIEPEIEITDPLFEENFPQYVQELEYLKGKKITDLSDGDKSKIMARVVDPTLHNTELAHKIIKLWKGKDHVCGKKTCHNSCHYQLKAKLFDLLFAQEMLE